MRGVTNGFSQWLMASLSLCNKNKKWLNDPYNYVENINSSRQTTIKEIPLEIQLGDTP